MQQQQHQMLHDNHHVTSLPQTHSLNLSTSLAGSYGSGYGVTGNGLSGGGYGGVGHGLDGNNSGTGSGSASGHALALSGSGYGGGSGSRLTLLSSSSSAPSTYQSSPMGLSGGCLSGPGLALHSSSGLRQAASPLTAASMSEDKGGLSGGSSLASHGSNGSAVSSQGLLDLTLASRGDISSSSMTETEDVKPLPSYSYQGHNSVVFPTLSSSSSSSSSSPTGQHPYHPHISHTAHQHLQQHHQQHHQQQHVSSSPGPQHTSVLLPISSLTPFARQQTMSLAGHGPPMERELSLDTMLIKQATEPPFSPSPPKAIPVTSEYDQSETEAAVQSLDNADILQLKAASVGQT